MWYIIILFILWLAIGYFFKSLTVATVILAIGLLIVLVWLFKTKRVHFKNDKEIKKYDGIEMRPIVNVSEKRETKVTAYASKDSSYETYHRPNDGFVDNMNFQIYRCKATFAKTNRKRTTEIEAFNETEVKECLKQAGFIEPFEIERIPFPEVTDKQKAALGNIYFGDVCQFDASALLSKQYEKDSNPNPELVAYATECGIKFSYYIGKKALYDLIFENVELKEKIAFFVFCIYRYTTDDRQGNLHNSLYRDYFYKFAEENVQNENFIKSMNKYSGQNLRFFGKLTVNNVQFNGGSTNTNAYKTVIEYLKQKFTLSTITSKTM